MAPSSWSNYFWVLLLWWLFWILNLGGDTNMELWQTLLLPFPATELLVLLSHFPMTHLQKLNVNAIVWRKAFASIGQQGFSNMEIQKDFAHNVLLGNHNVPGNCYRRRIKIHIKFMNPWRVSKPGPPSGSQHMGHDPLGGSNDLFTGLVYQIYYIIDIYIMSHN